LSSVQRKGSKLCLRRTVTKRIVSRMTLAAAVHLLRFACCFASRASRTWRVFFTRQLIRTCEVQGRGGGARAGGGVKRTAGCNARRRIAAGGELPCLRFYRTELVPLAGAAADEKLAATPCFARLIPPPHHNLNLTMYQADSTGTARREQLERAQIDLQAAASIRDCGAAPRRRQNRCGGGVRRRGKRTASAV
jgi:hypothetical protein